MHCRPGPYDPYTGPHGRDGQKAAARGAPAGAAPGREPSREEIAEQIEMPLDKVEQVLKIVKEPISLETPLGDEEESSLGDVVEDELAPSPVEAAIQQSRRADAQGIGDADATRRADPADALRNRAEDRLHSRRGRQTVRRHARTYSPNRGEGPAQAAPDWALAQPRGLHAARVASAPGGQALALGELGRDLLRRHFDERARQTEGSVAVRIRRKSKESASRSASTRWWASGRCAALKERRCQAIKFCNSEERTT
jgi:Sigma-70 region 3